MTSKNFPTSNTVDLCRAHEFLRVGILVLFTVLIWCFAYNRWTAEAWNVPLEYGIVGPDGDAPAIFANVKSAMDGTFPPLMTKYVPSLGAPFGANWNDFPLVEQLIYYFTGVVARGIGLFPAVNLAVLFAQILAAVAFYLVCRALQCDWRWAFAGALVFALSEYPFARQLHHLQVLYFWLVPACLLVVWWLASPEGLRIGEKRFWVAMAIGALMGAQHPYYTNMFVQLAGFACLYQWVRGDRRVVWAGAAIFAVTMGVFFLMCVNVFYYKLLHGPNPIALTRAFIWLEFSALKPLDMFIPSPGHRFPPFAALAQAYFKSVFVPGEVPPSSYLGLAGIASLGWLLFFSVRRTLARPPQLPPLEAWQVLWITVYSVVGGFNCFIGVLGVQFFRSSNRYSIFILAIVLIFAIRHLSAVRWQLPWGSALPALVCVVALWDQVPKPPTMDQIRALAGVVDADRQFVAAMEKRLPPNAMVFQLPIMNFPEEPAPGVPAYDHLRPYLYSKSLRFSFGDAKGRPESAWQQDLSKMEFGAAIDALEFYGFAALYINRNGFADRGASILQFLAKTGRNDVIESASGDRVCVMLRPSSYPIKPYIKQSTR